MCGAELHPTHRPLTLVIESVLVVIAVGVLVAGLWMLRPQPGGIPSAAALPTAIPTSTRIPTRVPTSTTIPTVGASVTTAPNAPAITTYTVKTGDTLLGIALRFNTTVASIVAASGLNSDRVTLRIGQTLSIPQSPEASSTRSSIAPQTPNATHPGSLQPTATAMVSTPTPGLPPDAVTHTVKRGEYIEFIAKQYGVTLDQIVQANSFKDADEVLQIGQVLVIHSGSAPTPNPTVPPTGTPSTQTPIVPPTRQTLVPATFTPAPTREFRYSAPALLGPPDGYQFRRQDTSVLLNWASVGILRDDEWYVVRVRIMQGEQTKEATEWVRTTSWRLPDSLHPTVAGEVYRYEWDVAVERQTGTSTDGTPTGVPASPRSVAYQFTWLP
ncbi:MAG: hypothetical protein A2Z04_02240 [Chloroflexi bacterium RBG_16_57_9]|nr:MAG: hypothetical protein A2Z04_02240 [Chloroflexi bacterium RBG_16_57_9]